MCLTTNFENNFPQFDKYSLIDVLLNRFETQSLDKLWFKKISTSYKSILEESSTPIVDIKLWFKDQIKSFKAFHMRDSFQKSPIKDHHCMSFVYLFLNDKSDDFYCNFNISVNDRIIKYLSLNGAKKTPEDKLKKGDFVIYNEKGKFGHIALFVGEINNTKYVISKYGQEFDAFMHPINSVGEHYGEAIYFTNPMLKENTRIKIDKILEELHTLIPSYSIKKIHFFEPEKIVLKEIEQLKTISQLSQI